MNRQNARMKFSPASGVPGPYPSHAAQWREYNGEVAWLFDPWTGERRPAEHVGADTFGLAIQPEGEPAPSTSPPEGFVQRKFADELRQQKDNAYLERNRCVALIARMARAMGFRVSVTRTAIEGWDEDWHNCVYIQLPTGQVSWHFHDSHMDLFGDLLFRPETWDGHDTEEKYRRVDEAFRDTGIPRQHVK